MWYNDEVKTAVKRKRLFGRKCWELEMKMQKKDVWKFIKKEKT